MTFNQRFIESRPVMPFVLTGTHMVNSKGESRCHMVVLSVNVCPELSEEALIL